MSDPDSPAGRFPWRRGNEPAWDADWDRLTYDQQVQRLRASKKADDRRKERDRVQKMLVLLTVVAMVALGLRLYGEQGRQGKQLSEDLARDRVAGQVRSCEDKNAFRREVRAVFDVLISDDSSEVPPITESPQFQALDPEEKDFVFELIRTAAESAGRRSTALQTRLDAYLERFPIENCSAIQKELNRRYGLDERGPGG